jgi:hydroxymethylbilane synthase
MCQLKAARPDLEVVPVRGNVPTRLGKVDSGQVEAVVLAAAGLRRLGHADRISHVLDPDHCLPAAGQGALGIETRVGDDELIALVRRAVHDTEASMCVTAERAFLGRLGGSCQTPLAAYARIDAEGEMQLDALIGRPDGTEILRGQRFGAAARAEALGLELAEELLGRGGGRILSELG